MNSDSRASDLIITIVPKGKAEKVLRASREAGAEGGTIMYGRGAGIHEKRTILGIPIEPEKEILLTVIPRRLTDKVTQAIVEAGNLNSPGAGIIFALELKSVGGICHVDELGGCPGGEE